MQIIEILITPVLVAIVGAVALVQSARRGREAKEMAIEAEAREKLREKKAEEREKRREEEAVLELELECATVHLAIVTALKLANKETNGQLGEAVEQAKNAIDDYKKFIRGDWVKQKTG